MQLGQQQHSYLYSYSLIALAIARAITGHTRTNKSTDYCPIFTWNYVINYTSLAREGPCKNVRPSPSFALLRSNLYFTVAGK